jgi:hypothetical protein
MIKGNMMKFVLIVILLFSALNVVQVMAESDLNVIWRTNIGDNKVTVTVFIKNDGDVGAYATPVATVEGIIRSYTQAAERTYIPPHEQVVVVITITGLIPVDYQHLSGLPYVSSKVTLTGTTNGGGTEPNGDGTTNGGGTEPNGDGTTNGGGRKQKDDVGISLPFDWTVIGVGVAVVVVIAAVVVVKRKKVTEKDLRKLSSNEFQNWVVKRLSGKPSSLRDARIGIDAYTAEGQPIQIKQLDNIGRNEIDTFASIMGQVKAKDGVVVAFSFSDDVYRGLVRARLNYGIEIKKVTVKELIDRGIKAL